jgi:hypothetical protein
VTLTTANAFRGPVSVAVSGANTASVNNTGTALTLGSVTTGSGAFSAAAGAAGISQNPNSILNLGGTASFSAAGGAIALTNRTNTFANAVGLTATNASIRATGGVILAASAVTDTLSVKTGGAATHSITQTGAITGENAAAFDAGAGNVLLTNAANAFDGVSVFSTGTAVSITDTNDLVVDTIRVGGGTLTLTMTTGGSLSQPGLFMV